MSPRRGAFVAVLAFTLLASLIGALPAVADPGAGPGTSRDAKRAWEQADHQAEVASEALNGARVNQARADQAEVRAASGVVTAKQQVQQAQHTAATADAAVSQYQGKLDQFANASFRGARLSDVSALLTATSADDFLDQATAIDRVAADTQRTLAAATAARTAAAGAKAAADDAEVRAEQSKISADTAKAAAARATADAKAKKAELEASVAKYKSLYAQLSEQERKAAAAAAEKIRLESEAAAARAVALAQQQAADRAAQAAAQAPAAQLPAPAAQAQAAQPPAAADSATPADPATPADQSTPSSSSSSSDTSSSSADAPSAGSGGDSAGQIAAQAAMTKIGGSYCFGCDGPESFDCSGLTTWAWAQAGVSIPRTSAEESNFPSVPLDQLQPGDLVTYYSPVSHVAIYVGNGMVVSAADESLGIIFVPVERGGPDASGHRVPRG